jgi:Fe-S cluster assembly protein SufD
MSPGNALIAADLTAGILDAFRDLKATSARTARLEALAHFEKLGFPKSKDEEYRFTPITRSLEKFFKPSDFSLETVPSALASIEKYVISSLSCNRVVFVNGFYREDLSVIVSPPEQLTVMPLEHALLQQADRVNAYFAKVAVPSTDAFVALNTTLWQSGVFIQVPKNTTLDKPVLFLNLHDSVLRPVVSQPRILALLEENSEACFVEEAHVEGSHPVFSSAVEEIVLKDYATLHHHILQRSPGIIQVSNTRLLQHQGSKVNTFTITLDGLLIRNNLSLSIDGERCESHFHGLYLLHKNTVADNHTVVDHRQPNSFSNELYKGIIDGHSKAVFNGKIYVRPHAQKTNAFQSNRNILLSDTATINTKPQLEIWADDVKCSHGCTSGQLDEEALFYLRSRGIEGRIARAMLLGAFAGEVLDPIRYPEIKNYFATLVSQRLQHES